MTAGLLFYGLFWAIFILPSHLFSSPESAYPPQSPSRIIRSQLLGALRAEKEKIQLPSWAHYQTLFKSWRKTLESTPSESQPSPALYDDLTHEIRTHAQMMIQALQLDRQAKHIEKSIVLPESSFILPSSSPEVDSFMKKQWPMANVRHLDSLEKEFHKLLKKLDPCLPPLIKDDFDTYRTLIKKWASHLTVRSLYLSTQQEIKQRLYLLYAGQCELCDQINDLTVSFHPTPIAWEPLLAQAFFSPPQAQTPGQRRHGIRQNLLSIFHILFQKNESLKTTRNILVRHPISPPLSQSAQRDEGIDLSSSIESTNSLP